MRTLFVFFLISLSVISVSLAQNSFPSNGNVGIGTSSPVSALDVRGTISTPEIAFKNANGTDDTDPYRFRKVQETPNVNWLELQINDDYNESFRIYGNSCKGFDCGTYSNNLYHLFDASGNAYHQGNLSIGTLNPNGYRLAVAGPMIAESVKVKVQSAWPDYVFSPGSKMMSLCQLEAFIKENQHLPDIPSEAEVSKEGVNLGEMNAALLKKVEELTLYIIELEKRVNHLESDKK